MFLGLTVAALLCGSAFVEMKNLIEDSTVIQPRKNICECGIPNRQQKIVGGHRANQHEFPWAVSLHRTVMLLFFGLETSQFCGGTLISENYVMTAAHCTRTYKMLPMLITANLGDYDLASSSESANVQKLVSEIKIHPDYNGFDFDNDISLLKLISPVTFTSVIRPACIPPPNLELDGKTATVSGWGTTAQGGPSSSVLLDVTLPIFSNEECQRFYNGTRVTITPKMMCAGYPEGGKDSCQGDSGGPMQFNCEQSYSVVGIVSFGMGCAKPGHPGVYARVSEFTSWIDQETKSEACLTGCNVPRNSAEVPEPSASDGAKTTF